MAGKNADLIRLLEAELDYIEGGGYGQRAGKPTEEQPLFYHSLACINHWQVPGHEAECHDECILLDSVPEKHRSEGFPCHYIPLNQKGDTVESLEQLGDRDNAEEQVKNWLHRTIQRLKDGEDVAMPSDVKY